MKKEIIYKGTGTIKDLYELPHGFENTQHISDKCH